jgi:hypothetical protein
MGASLGAIYAAAKDAGYVVVHVVKVTDAFLVRADLAACLEVFPQVRRRCPSAAAPPPPLLLVPTRRAAGAAPRLVARSRGARNCAPQRRVAPRPLWLGDVSPGAAPPELRPRLTGRRAPRPLPPPQWAHEARVAGRALHSPVANRTRLGALVDYATWRDSGGDMEAARRQAAALLPFAAHMVEGQAGPSLTAW